MARYLNLPMQSNSSFQNRILNEIIAAMNTIDLDPLPTDAEFLQQAQQVLFAGTFLPTSTAGQLQMLALEGTIWRLGFGNTTSSPAIALTVNNLQTNNFNANTATYGTLTFTNMSGQSPTTPTATFATMSVGGSTVITQATLPTIPPAIENSFALVTLTGNIVGTIGLIFNGNVLTMNINIQVAVAPPSDSTLVLITTTFANTTWQNFINRLAANQMNPTAVTLDQWIAGTNNSQDDVRAILRLTSGAGLTLSGINRFVNGSAVGVQQLNVGDRWNVMVTWAIQR